MRSMGWLLVGTALLSTVAVWADSDYLEARRLMEQGAILPLETIIEQAREQHRGRVLEVELEREDKGYVYEIEMLDRSGRVWELEMDAVTGEVLEQELED